MQTLRASCGKAELKISPSLQTPLLGVQDGQNLMSGRWL